MKILVIDCETTGLDWKVDNIIELGAVLYDWDTKKPIYLQSDNIIYDGELSDKIKSITGIDESMLQAPYAVPIKNSMFRLLKILKKADIIAGHNVQFDIDFILAACAELEMKFDIKPMIDTRYDLSFKSTQKSFKLNYLLADHQLYNPYAHRAVFDCLSTISLMEKFDINETLLNSESEFITVEAQVGFRAKDLAREMGFYWDGAQKKWLLKIKKRRFDEIKKDFPFKTKIEFEIPF